MSKILQSYLVRIGVKGTLTSRTSGNVHGVSSTDPHQVRGVLENKEIFDTIIPSQHESTKLFFRDINHGHVPGFLVNPLKKSWLFTGLRWLNLILFKERQLLFSRFNLEQLMVNGWFGARWFGFRLDPLMKGIVTYGHPDANPKPPAQTWIFLVKL